MEIEVTPEGVEIWHYTPEEWAAEEDEEVRRHSSFSDAREFTDAYFRGELSDGDLHVDHLVMKLGLGWRRVA
jgi:hypothetical protein